MGVWVCVCVCVRGVERAVVVVKRVSSPLYRYTARKQPKKCSPGAGCACGTTGTPSRSTAARPRPPAPVGGTKFSMSRFDHTYTKPNPSLQPQTTPPHLERRLLRVDNGHLAQAAAAAAAQRPLPHQPRGAGAREPPRDAAAAARATTPQSGLVGEGPVSFWCHVWLWSGRARGIHLPVLHAHTHPKTRTHRSSALRIRNVCALLRVTSVYPTTITGSPGTLPSSCSSRQAPSPPPPSSSSSSPPPSSSPNAESVGDGDRPCRRPTLLRRAAAAEDPGVAASSMTSNSSLCVDVLVGGGSFCQVSLYTKMYIRTRV